MKQLKPGVYVRVPEPCDLNSGAPRDFLCGQVVSVDDVMSRIHIAFHDPFDYRRYYGDLYLPVMAYPDTVVHKCELFIGTRAKIKKRPDSETFRIISMIEKGKANKYLVQSETTDTVLEVFETAIIAPFNAAKVSPLYQMKTYEFQNPIWFQKRTIVQRSINYLNNLMYGFKTVAGSKINLLPHQLQVIMRCLSESQMRYMLADEVGMGKTIEALAVLKTFMLTKQEQKILIVVPDALKEQWKMEMLLKFGFEPGHDEHGNLLELMSLSEFLYQNTKRKFDLIIVDEVHELVKRPATFIKLLPLCSVSDNVLLLSATPVRHLTQDYLKLLQLLDPQAYSQVTPSQFEEILKRQKSIMTKVLDANDSLEEMVSSADEDDEDLLEEYFDEILEAFQDILDEACDAALEKQMQKIDFSSPDHGIKGIKLTITYLAEAYQVEKNILKNRRIQLEKNENDDFHLPRRHLIELPYELSPDQNVIEYTNYQSMLNWISEQDLSSDVNLEQVKMMIQTFFGSPWAYSAFLEKRAPSSDSPLYPLLIEARKWMDFENETIKLLPEIMEDPFLFFERTTSRLYRVVDYLDQELGDRKAVVFVSFSETFAAYKEALMKAFPVDRLAFFDSSQDISSLEDNSYRFQNDKKCQILLSDPTGGEGRNFQNASYIIHADLPWDAGMIEQRIGRLDRLERDQNNLDVYSVVPYAEDTLESGMLSFWKKGLKIFEKSLSGLEIVMGLIQNKLSEVIRDNLITGMYDIFDEMNNLTEYLIQEVRREQSFDILSTMYSGLNSELNQELTKYGSRENSLFASALMGWAALAGFKGRTANEGKGNIVQFNRNSFSPNAAKKALLIPPEWKCYLTRPENRYLLRVLSHFEQNPEQAIKGTFLRKEAVKNDFIRFFAPGDAVFDSITENALQSTRGQCAAIRIKGDFSWKGFVMIWRAEPQEVFLHKAGLPVSLLAQYRHYLYSELMYIPYSIENPDDRTDDQIRNIFWQWIESNAKKTAVHLGERKKHRILVDDELCSVSNLENFMQVYPQSSWIETVSEAREYSFGIARQEVLKRSRIRDARSEIDRRFVSQNARKLHYGLKIDLEEQTEESELIIQALSHPLLVLDSAIYIEIKKAEDSNE